MPLLGLIALHVAFGAIVALAASRELRASPRAVHEITAFRALAVHETLIALPVTTFFLVRFPGWTLSYVVDSERVPSVVTAALILLCGALALGAFTLGAHWIRDHRLPWIAWSLTALTATVVMAALVARHRLGIVATTAEYRSGFGLRPLAHSGLSTAAICAVLGWGTGAGHLFWFLSRRV